MTKGTNGKGKGKGKVPQQISKLGGVGKNPERGKHLLLLQHQQLFASS